MNELPPQTLLYTERGTTWINSFPPRDREAARWLVDGLTLVSLSTFSRAIHRMVTTESQVLGGPIALFAIREINTNVSYFRQAAVKNKSAQFVSPLTNSANIGSEGHVASIIRQITNGDPLRFLNHPTIRVMRNRQCRSILAIDDLIGSGNRARRFLDAIWLDRTIRSWWSLGHTSLRAIAFSSTSHGMQHVARAKYKPSVVIDRTCPTYPELPWPRHKREAISSLCRLYGKHTSKPGMAMGYRHIMAGHDIRAWLPQQHSRDTVGRACQRPYLAAAVSTTHDSDRYADGISTGDCQPRSHICITRRWPSTISRNWSAASWPCGFKTDICALGATG